MHYLTQQIENYLWYCKTQKRLSAGTLKAYRIDLTKFHTYLGRLTQNEEAHILVQDIDKHVLKLYLGEINELHKAKTVKRKMTCIRGFFYFWKKRA